MKLDMPIRALAVLAIAALAGCNTISSEKPLFSAADAAGAAQLRPGLWRLMDKKDCVFRESRPVSRWPKCAEWFLIRPGQVAFLEGKAPKEWVSYGLLVAAGEPQVMQLEWKNDKGDIRYLYAGLEAVRSDPEGRIVEYRRWSALCGPPPPESAQNQSLTLELLPGLKVEPEAKDCTADDPAPVRVSAKLSRGWTKPDEIESGHWVRDAEN